MTAQASPEPQTPLDVAAGAPVEKAAAVLDFIAAHEAKYGTTITPTYFLSGAAAGDRIELTSEMHQLLKQVAQAISQRKSVSVLSRDHELTTQQAAEILGLSRPTVVKLIDQGELKATVPGTTRRKLRLVDVLTYQESLQARRDRFIEESSAAYALEDEFDEADIADALKRAKSAQDPTC